MGFPRITPLPDDLEIALIEEGVSSYRHDLRGRAALEIGDYARAEQKLSSAAAASRNSSHRDTLGVAFFINENMQKRLLRIKKLWN